MEAQNLFYLNMATCFQCKLWEWEMAVFHKRAHLPSPSQLVTCCELRAPPPIWSASSPSLTPKCAFHRKVFTKESPQELFLPTTTQKEKRDGSLVICRNNFSLFFNFNWHHGFSCKTDDHFLEDFQRKLKMEEVELFAFCESLSWRRSFRGIKPFSSTSSSPKSLFEYFLPNRILGHLTVSAIFHFWIKLVRTSSYSVVPALKRICKYHSQNSSPKTLRKPSTDTPGTLSAYSH